MNKRQMDAIKKQMESVGFTDIVTIHAKFKDGKWRWMVEGRGPDHKPDVFSSPESWAKCKFNPEVTK